MGHRSGSAGGALRSLVAAVGAAAAAWTLGARVVESAPQAGSGSAAAMEAGVVLLVLAAGSVAAAVLAIGCALLALASAARLLGAELRAVEHAAARLTPALVRRALAVGIGGVLVASPAAAAESAPPPGLDLGWTVTTTQPAQADTSTPVEPVAPAVPVAVHVPTPDEPGPAPAPAPDDLVHVVAPGDTLWGIARDHLPTGADDADVAAAWPGWYAANADVVGPDPDLVLPGQRLRAPAGTTPPEAVTASSTAVASGATAPREEQP